MDNFFNFQDLAAKRLKELHLKHLTDAAIVIHKAEEAMKELFPNPLHSWHLKFKNETLIISTESSGFAQTLQLKKEVILSLLMKDLKGYKEPSIRIFVG